MVVAPKSSPHHGAMQHFGADMVRCSTKVKGGVFAAI